MKNKRFPEPSDCPVSCNSWVITNDAGTFETWDRGLALYAFIAGDTLQTAYDYLITLNAPLID